MEKRRSERKSVNLSADLFADGRSFTGFIENVCEHGLHLIAASKKRSPSFIPEKTLELKVGSLNESSANIHCEVRWVHINKTPIHGLTYRMGMEILEQPSAYKEFLDTLK